MKKTFLQKIAASLLLLWSISALTLNAQKYSTDPESTLEWFRDARFGMFIHFHIDNKSEFNPKGFNAGEWARVARKAGMKYVVLTSKHHAGFCLWDSEHTEYNIVDHTPYDRDVVKDLVAGCEEEGIRFGTYYSIADYNHPMYEPKYQNRANRRTGTLPGADITKYIDFMFAQLEDLCQLYQPCLVWFDGGSGFRSYAYKPLLRRQELVDMLHTYGTISNSRLGDDDSLNIVDYLSLNDNLAPPMNLGVDFESAVTMGDSWNFKDDDELKTPKELLERLVNAAGNGGNLLLNVGPDHHGEIPEGMVDRLMIMGEWLEKNGEAIYGTEGGPYVHEIAWGTITQRKEKNRTSLYLNVVDWPEDGKFTLFGVNNPVLSASLLANGVRIQSESEFDASSGQHIITLDIPLDAPDEYVSVIKVEVSGDVCMDDTYMQLGNGKVVLDTYTARIHDLEYVSGKPARAIDLKMHTVQMGGEGIMPGRGMTVSGFHTRGQALSWDFRMYEPGTYEVVVVCHAGRDQDWNPDGRVRVHVAGQFVENKLEEEKRLTIPTATPRVVDLYSVLGTVEINSAGAHTLSLEIAEDFFRRETQIPQCDFKTFKQI